MTTHVPAPPKKNMSLEDGIQSYEQCSLVSGDCSCHELYIFKGTTEKSKRMEKSLGGGKKIEFPEVAAAATRQGQICCTSSTRASYTEEWWEVYISALKNSSYSDDVKKNKKPFKMM